MHIDPATHEHGASAKVYTYEVDYDVGPDAITWKASLSEGGVPLDPIAGSIPLSSPGLATLAQEVVRDEIVKRIDSLDDTRSGTA